MKKILVIILSFSFCIAVGQTTVKTAGKKADSYYQSAVTFFENSRNAEARISLYKAIKEAPDFVEANLLMSEIFIAEKKADSAIVYLRKAVAIDPGFFPPALFSLAKLELSAGLYADADLHFSEFSTYPQAGNFKEELEKNKNAAMFALDKVAHPVAFSPQNLGDSINSRWDEYLPALTADGKTLIITRRMPTIKGEQIKREDAFYEQLFHDYNPGDKLPGNMAWEEDFYISYFDDSTQKWSKAVRMPEPVNSSENEGAQSISPDGRYLFFTGCNRPDGFGSCDIYVCRKDGDKWGKPINLWEPVNTRGWESMPSIAADGVTLYFSSNRPGGKGATDIYVSKLRDDGIWTTPQNLGDSINTGGNEICPFIHPDGKTLYFASNGHPGMGGYDLFFSRKKDDGTWSTPVNLGYPINTHGDESGLIVNAKGDKAYFASNMPGGFGMQDVYSFDLYEEARPVLVTYMKGIIFDKQTNRLLEATAEVIALQSNILVAKAQSDPVSGEFLISLPAGEEYAVNVSKQGYLFYSENVVLSDTNSDIAPFTQNIPLKAIKVGEITVLNNIFFETNAYVLKKESYVELDKLMKMLKEQPHMRIEIGGHTDNTGAEAYNLTLSEKRAKAVYDYLVENNIDASRLTYVGYGYRNSIASNDTEEGRRMNRRTEVKIISN